MREPITDIIYLFYTDRTMKKVIFALLTLMLLSLTPLGVAEEMSYSVAVQVGDGFEFEHSRAYEVVVNGSVVDAFNETFIAAVNVTGVDLVNATDPDFGNYTDMVISSDISVGNETINATESLYDAVFLNQALGFGMDIIMSEIANDSVEFVDLGGYGYFVENNASLAEQFVADIEEFNFSSYLDLAAFGEFELLANDTYSGGFSLAVANDTFTLLANESYFFASEGNVTVDLFVDYEVDMNLSIVTKAIKYFTLSIGNDSLFFEDSYVEYVAPVVVETTAEETTVETTEEEEANFILFAIPLALIPILRRRN